MTQFLSSSNVLLLALYLILTEEIDIPMSGLTVTEQSCVFRKHRVAVSGSAS